MAAVAATVATVGRRASCGVSGGGCSRRALTTATAPAPAPAPAPNRHPRREDATAGGAGAGDCRRRPTNQSLRGRVAQAVAVTGIGAVSPLGSTFRESYREGLMLPNRSGVTSLAEALEYQYHSSSNNSTSGETDPFYVEELERAAQLSCQVAAAVRPYEHHGYNPRTTARFVQFALRAAEEAVEHAGLAELLLSAGGGEGGGRRSGVGAVDKDRVGVSIGSGLSHVREIARAASLPSYRKLSPHFVPTVLSNGGSGRVAIRFGLRGPNLSPSTACAAATHAIGDAVRCIRSGQADIMLAGGAEAAIDALSLAGFGRLRALSTSFNDRPHEASRPFDDDRDGFVMGEGAAVLVLEELDHALDRGAAILALATGYGASGDGYHVTAPEPDGVGARLCMHRALDEAALHWNDDRDNGGGDDDDEDLCIYVNAHATSTPKGDEIEARAIDRVFFGASESEENDTGNSTGTVGGRFNPSRVLVSSTKGNTGHLLGAAGALEAAFAVQALRDQRVPPTLNLQRATGLGLGQQQQQQQQQIELVQGDVVPVNDLHLAVSNSFGFGGTNACLVFQRWKG